MEIKKILLIGPFPEPITGMSLANKVLYKSFKKKDFKVYKINTSLYSFDENVGKFTLKKFLYFLKINIYLYKIFKVNIVYITPGHTFFGIAKYILFFSISKLFNKKIITHIHNNALYFEYENVSKIKQLIMRFVLSKSTSGIVLSESLKENLIPFMPLKNIFVVNNFVEQEFISTERNVINKKADILHIVFLSNLMTKKGIFYFLKSLKELSKKGIKHQTKIAGHIDKSNREKIIREINKIENVNYLGVVSGVEKKELLEWGNTFVFPSFLNEGLPICILEAMANGHSVISTKHPSLLDLFSEKAITYIDKKSSRDIVKALMSVNDLKKKQIVLNNFIYVSKNFTVSKFVNSTLKVIFVVD